MKSNLKILFTAFLVVLFFNCKDNDKQAKESTTTSSDQTEERTGQAFIEDDGSTPNILQIAIGSKSKLELI